jgi:hypothetical protein
MEITLSKRSLLKVLILLMLAALLFGLYLGWSEEILADWLGTNPPAEISFEDQPALHSLSTMYSPAGERSDWEGQVCRGMTEQGCELFRSMYAEPIWNSLFGAQASTAVFIASAETLEDGSQIWKTEVTGEKGTQPMYIHVYPNESGQWLLNRVLFTQETTKYEDQ